MDQPTATADPLRRTTRSDYDPLGPPRNRVDAKNQATTFHYLEDGKLREVIDARTASLATTMTCAATGNPFVDANNHRDEICLRQSPTVSCLRKHPSTPQRRTPTIRMACEGSSDADTLRRVHLRRRSQRLRNDTATSDCRRSTFDSHGRTVARARRSMSTSDAR